MAADSSLAASDSHDDICAELCARAGLRRPLGRLSARARAWVRAAFDDACGGIRVGSEDDGSDQSLLLCGESAGGNLCRSCRARNARGGVRTGRSARSLSIPGSAARHAQSYVEHAEAPLLRAYERSNSIAMSGQAASRAPARDPTLRAIARSKTKFSDLPPTVIFTAECDPLCFRW